MTFSLDLGFVALTDAAPLIVAKERGLFAKEGVDVSLHREVSWATIRDKVAAGLFQGAHVLAPLAIAARLGVGSDPVNLIAPMSLNSHGAAIGVSAELAAEMDGDDAKSLVRAVAKRLGRGDPPVTFATVFPYSMHTYMLRYWIASAGLDPDRDIHIVTAPPTAVFERLKSGSIDGFCVGAPWGAVCEEQCGARIVLEAGEFWPGGPDKVLGISETWAAKEPEAMLAVLRGLLRAALWADAPEHAGELAGMLSATNYLAAPAELVAKRLVKDDKGLRFSRQAASFPWRSQAAWIFSQMLRWGQVDRGVDAKLALECYRPDLFHTAASDVGLSGPLADSKVEGEHEIAWALPGSRGPIPMSRDLFFDRTRFDPDSLKAYAAGFAITRLTE
ncbi:MAG: CmpA/NrtA family ABC transporter substrate-binding protein [Hyphomonadaceae bacterium]|nr:CmpA/NrtA family ABC transporter substrate-binding protein [Hyphomonadaceae bacterium]